MAFDIMKLSFCSLYNMYIDKVVKKGRTTDELNVVICWLTGFDRDGLYAQLNAEATVEQFFTSFPNINPNAHLITGRICGYKIEDIADPTMRRIRYLDKLVDELAKGRPLEKILRS